MIKILFICHGKYCRSTMSECVMKHLIATAGSEAEFEVDSAATSTEEIGNSIYPLALTRNKKRGLLNSGYSEAPNRYTIFIRLLD